MADDKKEEPKVEEPQETPPEPEEGHSEDPPRVEPKKEEQDRTGEQFEKLTESNKELKEERDRYKKLYESYEQPTKEVPNAQNYSNLSQPEINNVVAGLVDNEGYMDGAKLMRILSDMNRRAENAEKSAQAAQKQLRDFEETNATREVHKKYPQLDPNNQEGFDEAFFDAVYNELKGGALDGKEPKDEDYVKAADKWYGRLYKEREVKKKDKEAQEKVEEQRSASQAVKSTGSPVIKGYYDSQEEAEIVKAVRQGKKGAIAEMLKRRGL